LEFFGVGDSLNIVFFEIASTLKS